MTVVKMTPMRGWPRACARIAIGPIPIKPVHLQNRNLDPGLVVINLLDFLFYFLCI